MSRPPGGYEAPSTPFELPVMAPGEFGPKREDERPEWFRAWLQDEFWAAQAWRPLVTKFIITDVG